MGKMSVEEVDVDDKERVLIPKEVRDKVGLKTGGKARMKVEDKRIIVMPPISPEEFIDEMEGCIKEGTPKINPLKLKEIWGNVREKSS
ncbi:MAG: AbrB/MazE/SpoVT family DNA-binding domain-containing protein [Candidatus Brockarchaeota archaeon]|nr:AbrB/MazE/SpoVT family DNA-binding domain-containing protein [Candidatus Brockarchaeota archaeon]